jgi:hypothetical protein
MYPGHGTRVFGIAEYKTTQGSRSELLKEYVGEPKSHGLEVNKTRVGKVYENAQMRSFFNILKWKEMYLWEYRTPVDLMELFPYSLPMKPLVSTARAFPW